MWSEKELHFHTWCIMRIQLGDSKQLIKFNTQLSYEILASKTKTRKMINVKGILSYINQNIDKATNWT